MPLNAEQVNALHGTKAVDSAGEKIGKVGQVFTSNAAPDGLPDWVTLTSGIFGNRENFAPLAVATLVNGELVFTVTKHVIRGAPDVSQDGQLTDMGVRALYAYYQVAGVPGVVIQEQEIGAPIVVSPSLEKVPGIAEILPEPVAEPVMPAENTVKFAQGGVITGSSVPTAEPPGSKPDVKQEIKKPAAPKPAGRAAPASRKPS
jgi:hypothetical protein